MQAEEREAYARVARLAHTAWSEALGHDDFDGASSFFRAGGYSTLGLVMMKQLSDEFGANLPARVLFDNPVFDDFVAAVAAMNGDGP